MSTERNVLLVRRYFEECVNRVNGPDPARALAVVDELMTDDFTMAYNNETDADAARGRDRHKEFLKDHARWFPNDRWSIEAIAGSETVVACQWRIEATHVRRGNPIDVRAADFFTVRSGQLAALRRFLDFKSLDEQIDAGQRP